MRQQRHEQRQLEHGGHVHVVDLRPLKERGSGFSGRRQGARAHLQLVDGHPRVGGEALVVVRGRWGQDWTWEAITLMCKYGIPLPFVC